ncbi:hypothetical protein TUBRATIS_16030 [Tubulinosema ratisbonensis]|uniref:Uncharacterized protein n=1 Tax=Tubulinosema ratisbonensis TaxID=291195 RepID=A0A437ALD4_9MICR|nr:hypothetical protein TUBRATIS_16030 [Tubulinosema ratisbonensis]
MLYYLLKVYLTQPINKTSGNDQRTIENSKEDLFNEQIMKELVNRSFFRNEFISSFIENNFEEDVIVFYGKRKLEVESDHSYCKRKKENETETGFQSYKKEEKINMLKKFSDEKRRRSEKKEGMSHKKDVFMGAPESTID